MRLVINDTFMIEDDSTSKVMRVTKISGNGQITIAPIHESNVAERGKKAGVSSPAAGGLQKAKARSVTISPIGELRDPGFQG